MKRKARNHELANVPAEINRLHSEIIEAARTTIEKAIRIGELLTRAKRDAGHGTWGSWMKSNLNFSERSAQRYMRLFDKRHLVKSDTLSDLSQAYALLTEPQPERLPEPAEEPTSFNSPPPDDEKTTAQDIERHADEGLELLVWNKVKDELLPVLNQLREKLDPDEREILTWAILKHYD